MAYGASGAHRKLELLMKIKDFTPSPKKINRSPSQFILSNEQKENHLENQIKELQTDLSKLSKVAEENNDLRQRASKYNNKEQTMRQEIVSLHYENRESASEIERLLKFQRDNHDLTAQIKNCDKELDNLRSITDLAKLNNMQKDKKLIDLQKRFDILFDEEAGMRSELNQAQNKLQNQRVELSKYSKIYNETKDLLNVTQDTLQDAKKQVQQSKDEEIFWRNRVDNLEQEVMQLTNIEQDLRNWSSNLKVDSEKTMGMNKMNTEKLSHAQQTIADMGNTITNLIKDTKYTRELNSKLQYEVSRPRYASMGAIAKNEGFVMPMGKENIRTKFLGNSSPKLLKFKEKHNDN